jgi:fluoroquinolone resistance protein
VTTDERLMLPDQDLEDESFEGLDLREAVMVDQSFESCVFEDCDLSGVAMARSRFLDCRFVGCNLSNISLSGAALIGVDFETCKLAGVDFSTVTRMTFDVSFEESELSWCVFTDRPWRKAKIRNSRLRECEFETCDMGDADFWGSSFPGSRFTRCTLRGADFRNATEYAFDPRENHVKGARFSLPDVVSLLSPFDIRIQ